MAIALLILGMMLVTYSSRLLPMALMERLLLPVALQRWLEYVPTAAFAVIVAQGVFAPQGQPAFAAKSPYLWGAVVAGLVAWRSRNLLLTMVAGMAGYWLLRLAGG